MTPLWYSAADVSMPGSAGMAHEVYHRNYRIEAKPCPLCWVEDDKKYTRKQSSQWADDGGGNNAG